jgi:hypothetical protein
MRRALLRDSQNVVVRDHVTKEVMILHAPVRVHLFRLLLDYDYDEGRKIHILVGAKQFTEMIPRCAQIIREKPRIRIANHGELERDFIYLVDTPQAQVAGL